MTESISLAVHSSIHPSLFYVLKQLKTGFKKGQGGCLQVGFIWGEKKKSLSAE